MQQEGYLSEGIAQSGWRGRRSTGWAERADLLDVMDRGTQLDEVVERAGQQSTDPAARLAWLDVMARADRRDLVAAIFAHACWARTRAARSSCS